MDDISQKNILIAGLARNCGGTIRQSVAQLRDALKPFKSLQWLVIESDSSDDTLAALENLQAIVPGFRSFRTVGCAISFRCARKGLPIAGTATSTKWKRTLPMQIQTIS